MTIPDGQTLKYFEYLDSLRESGETNMLGAGPYLQSQFGLEAKEARAVLARWIDSFAERHPERKAG